MDKDALTLIIAIVIVSWILIQISGAAGRKARQKEAARRAPKADSLKTIFQYMDAAQYLLDRCNELNTKYMKLIADKHQLIAIMNDPNALDKLNRIEKNFINCILDATVYRDEIDNCIELRIIDLKLYNALEDVVTYMEMYIQEIEEMDVDMYDADDRDAYEERTAWENEARAGMYGKEFQEDFQERDSYHEDSRYERQTGRQSQNNNQYGGYQQQNQQRQSYQQHSNSDNFQSVDSYFTGCNSIEEVEKRYKALAKVFHPDSQTGNDASFKQLQASYEEAKKKF